MPTPAQPSAPPLLQLRLLHLCHAPGRGAQGLHDTGRGAGGGAPRRPAGLHRGALHAGCAVGQCGAAADGARPSLGRAPPLGAALVVVPQCASRAPLYSRCNLRCACPSLFAGDKPELLYPEAAAELAAMGYSSTLDYVAAAAGAVLRETGLLPHVNAGGCAWRPAGWGCALLGPRWVGLLNTAVAEPCPQMFHQRASAGMRDTPPSRHASLATPPPPTASIPT